MTTKIDWRKPIRLISGTKTYDAKYVGIGLDTNRPRIITYLDHDLPYYHAFDDDGKLTSKNTYVENIPEEYFVNLYEYGEKFEAFVYVSLEIAKIGLRKEKSNTLGTYKLVKVE